MIATPLAPALTYRSTMSNAEGIPMDEPIPYVLAPEGREPVHAAPRAEVVEAVEEDYLVAIHAASKLLAEAGFDGLVIVQADPYAVAAHLREAIDKASKLLR